ncbi:MAG: quinone-dependent dihydroorotate dehydrogenase [Bacteroidales bacterium]|nr:quinone-dependent dihydroorotate dehydrogenase [Bacteroidales bacterium]MDD2425450.1 quinone-dependent dihydroorotate dehydrogenase [Bacteroidales bacterium]MDD3988564.1 quinone-dependent dihydroorotate dehydrogenase [Bacteroidales bacterium]MDD4639440.1 quinone-dependent dihydroorotate dehydrogenase [Bacteroidales bacterium]
MYKLLKPLFFSFSAETAHKMVVNLLLFLRYIPFSGKIIRMLYHYKNPKLEKEVMGLKFDNPIGLAAGFDKNGDIYNDMANFGFGFIEIGSLTPFEQIGNPKPRIFRLTQDNALINRMGINNKGVRHAVRSLENKKPEVIIGGNISKCSSTPNDLAAKDYEKCFAQLYDFVDYFTINVSCPNVKGLTQLQNISMLSEIVDRLTALRRFYDNYRPILLKVSPDLTNEQLDEVIELILVSGLDGVVAANTTLKRENLVSDPQIVKSAGDGGLSGAPLFDRTLEIIRYICKKSNGVLPVIGSGGITTVDRAQEMLDAGASLVQIYTGFIYNGPGFVKQILKHLANR